MEIIEFVKEKKELIINKLREKGFILENEDFDKIRTGSKIVSHGRSRTSYLVKDERIATFEIKKELKNHTLPYRWVSIDFSFNKKKNELEVDGQIIHYSCCIL